VSRSNGVAFGSSVACAILTPFAALDVESALATNALSAAALPGALLQLLSALAYMHSVDVVHGNISPTSVLVAADGRVLLGGLGYAHSVRAAAASSTILLRVPAWNWYTAPEVLLNVSAGQPHNAASADLKRCDIWSVGALAARVVLRTDLFTGNAPDAVLQSIARFSETDNAAGAAESLEAACSMAGGSAFASFVLVTLQRDPLRRWTAAKLVKHDYVGGDDRSLPATGASATNALADDLTDDTIVAFVDLYCPRLKSKL
jgi:serine/threonine protein kinase